ncbi:NIF3-like protein 1 isoform X1 [Anguilla anguilla]|uniref:NIF3-like protein 1 n=2 Tax=Anguilla anguilla TaxID=7936 RepID=A0A0E9X5A9_ANGAN|nr:NIF3-like protein 1 isoform X1 [Anguilla anguilla]KAG5854720.1 hypothetical protein ANANG_G00040780 [Anguilla anguilla]
MLPGWVKASLRPFTLPFKLACFSTCSFSFYKHHLALSHSVLSPQKTLGSYISSPSVYANFYTSFHILATSSTSFIFSQSFCKKLFFPTPLSYSLSQSPSLFQSSHSCKPMDLSEVLEVLENLAPLPLAEPWDNVGLLVEPSKVHPVKTVLLTNDLTVPVMDEAEAMNCDLIVSYHPPLFRPIKRLVQRDWKQQLAIRAVKAGIAIYSPHTALDCVRGGVNDWLIGGVGSGSVSVLSQAASSTPLTHKLEFTVRNHEELKMILAELMDTTGKLEYTTTRSDGDGYNVSLICPDSILTAAVQTLSQHATSKESLSILQLTKLPLPGCGQGRRSILDEPISIATAVQRIKSHLGLSHVRLALGAQHTLESAVNTVAVCAGSGGSVLNAVKADLYITGEMSHHEVLDAVAAGTSVILSDHSNSERGFLSVLKERLSVRLSDSISIKLSQRDRDPLEIL